MPRSARRYDIYLPLADNEGVRFPRRKFTAVEHRLLAHFQGITAQQQQFPFQGLWQEGGKVYSDQVIVLASLDYRRARSARFIAQLKRDLLREFEQLEILITETALRVH
jgi:hypothetical protein